MIGDHGVETPYWDGLASGRLLLPRCGGCRRWIWPACHRCGRCGHVGLDWRPLDFRARVFSWTRTWHRFALTEALPLPFTSVLASIEGAGIRLLGLLDDPHRIDPVIGEPIVGRPGTIAVNGRTLPMITWARVL